MSEKGIPKVRVRFKAKSKQLPFPRSVRVGCYTYAVVPEGHQDTIAVGFHGATNHVGMKIQVDVSTSAQQTANTFLHEVIHATSMASATKAAKKRSQPTWRTACARSGRTIRRRHNGGRSSIAAKNNGDL